MSREAGGTAVLLVGLLLVRLTVADVYQRYVRVEMGPWLLVAGTLLVGLGAATVVLAIRRPVAVAAAGRRDPDHEHTDRVGWLLLVPVLALLLAPPPALGSFGVSRSTPGVSIGAGGRTYGPLPPGDPSVLTLRELDERALDRGGETLAGRVVALTGFVAGSDGGGFQLARYQISCCAADATAAVVQVLRPGEPAPTRDTWLTVVGVFRGVGPDGVPELTTMSVLPEQSPVDPYE